MRYRTLLVPTMFWTLSTGALAQQVPVPVSTDPPVDIAHPAWASSRVCVKRKNKAAALRHAKIDLLAKYGRQVPPYYWGAFILVGDGGSPIPLGGQ